VGVYATLGGGVAPRDGVTLSYDGTVSYMTPPRGGGGDKGRPGEGRGPP
jgi:hypothetical protein